ncbi:hypothetical protein KCP77_09275 [Salmonella enterica subsp. enterica]|nr:hypothetical protein KCP77_09275 [Salmonella enterica subsp. enterica]
MPQATASCFAPHPAAQWYALSGQSPPQSGGGRRRWPENLLVTVANPISKPPSGCSSIPALACWWRLARGWWTRRANRLNKRLIAAGAGNPPVVVGWYRRPAARCTIHRQRRVKFDNNIICADEKVLIVVDKSPTS